MDQRALRQYTLLAAAMTRKVLLEVLQVASEMAPVGVCTCLQTAVEAILQLEEEVTLWNVE